MGLQSVHQGNAQMPLHLKDILFCLSRHFMLFFWIVCLFFSLLHGTKNVANCISTRLPRQNSDGGQKNKPCEHIIDCGDIVWSLAFGSSVPEKQSRCVNIEWHRFKFGQDQLLLATGLNNGRIKIWDVYTGRGWERNWHLTGTSCTRNIINTLNKLLTEF